MWCRVIEFMLAAWLAVSPFVFFQGEDVSDYLPGAQDRSGSADASASDTAEGNKGDARSESAHKTPRVTKVHPWWANDAICASLIAIFSLASFVDTMKRAHLLEIPVALWLVGYAWYTADPQALAAETPHVAAPLQNHILVGLLLLMFAVIPSRAAEPPKVWRERQPKAASEAVDAEYRYEADQ